MEENGGGTLFTKKASVLDTPEYLLEKGIRFELGQKKDREEMWKFLLDDFTEDEPMYRSMGVADNTLWDRIVLKDLYEIGVEKATLKETSILARNREGMIVGLKSGYPVTDSDPGKSIQLLRFYDYLHRAFGCLMSLKMHRLILSGKLVYDHLRYLPHYAMNDIGCQSVFVGEVLCVGRAARGMGLGKEMVKKSMEVAKEKFGCEAYFACLTGIYSQGIYAKLGFTTMREVVYEEYRDRNGDAVINDAREHKLCRTVYKML